METKVIRKVSKKTFKDTNGKERNYVNYELRVTLENGNVMYIPFKPNYDFDKNVFTKLNLIATNESDVIFK